MTVRVPVSPDVLRWAQERSRHDETDFERKFTGWNAWLNGEKTPTMKQVEQIANYAHLPFGIFFLDEPPEVSLPIPDYRLGIDGDEKVPSQDLLDVIQQSLTRQTWYQEYATRNGLERSQVGRSELHDDIATTADAVREEMGFGIATRDQLKTREAARKYLRKTFELLGGLTVFTSMVGNNNTRMLDRAEFRGFTLANDIVPLIFVNTHKESVAGQIFTFFHEYAHVRIRKTGVSDEHAQPVNHSGVEAWCNAVAAEVLVPQADLKEKFDDSRPFEEELDRLSRRYMASTLVILIKLRDLELLPTDGFEERYRHEEKRVKYLAEKAREASGGTFWNVQPMRIGERFGKAVLADVAGGQTSFTEAFRLLSLRNVKQLNELAKHLE